MIESFEKMDKEFLDGLKNIREKKVPDTVRQNFKQSVERRIMSAGRPAGFGFSFAMLPVFVLAAGVALCWFYLRPNRPVPVNVEIKQESAPIQTPALVLKTVPEAPVKIQPNAPKLEEITESNLVAELEALKELGVWTEQDEEEIGIPADLIFEELEAMIGEMPAGETLTVPQASTQG